MSAKKEEDDLVGCLLGILVPGQRSALLHGRGPDRRTSLPRRPAVAGTRKP